MKCDSCGRTWAANHDEHEEARRNVWDLIICRTCRCERERALDYRRRVREEREKMEQPDWVKREIDEPPRYRDALEQLTRAAEGAADLIRAIRPACDHHGEYIHLIEALDRARGMLGEWVPEHRSGPVKR